MTFSMLNTYPDSRFLISDVLKCVRFRLFGRINTEHENAFVVLLCNRSLNLTWNPNIWEIWSKWILSSAFLFIFLVEEFERKLGVDKYIKSTSGISGKLFLQWNS